jgi:glycosyltransferase involved in cell wall biosynthesis
VFRGTKFVGEALQSIQAQTHSNLDVLVSVDGADHESAALCERLVRDDPRFSLVIQESQLGWAANIRFLMSQNKGAFWYFHQQDDIVSPDYIQSLLEHARKHPVLYSDLEAFGTLELVMHQNLLLFTPAAREIGLLHDHLAAVAFRGLIDQAGGVRQRDRILCGGNDLGGVGRPRRGTGPLTSGPLFQALPRREPAYVASMAT